MDELTYQILEEIRALQQRVDMLTDAWSQLYIPSPSQAESDRSMLPFVKKFTGDMRIPYEQNALPNFRGKVIYTSPALRTEGFTCHNAFVSMEVASDSVPTGTGDHLLFTLVLEGSAGSGWVELDVAEIFSTGRTGPFPVPLLAEESLSIDTRFVLWAGDNATYSQPPPATPRLIRLSLAGVLVSGYKS